MAKATAKAPAKAKVSASVDYREGLHERLQDVEYAADYLSAALDDEDERVFLLALRDVAEAHGISRVAKEAELNRENLYRILKASSNPRWSSISALLHALGLQLVVRPVE